MGVRLRVENSFAPGAGLASSPAVSSADSVVAASVDALGEFLEVVWLRRVELRIFLGGLPVRLLAGHGAFAGERRASRKLDVLAYELDEFRHGGGQSRRDPVLDHVEEAAGETVEPRQLVLVQVVLGDGHIGFVDSPVGGAMPCGQSHVRFRGVDALG